MTANILIPLATGFEEMEAIIPIDLLRRAGATVTTVAVGSALEVEGKNGIVVQADRAFAEVDLNAFDLLLLPGGPAAKQLRENTAVLDLVRSYAGRNAWIAAICAAPTILKEAGVLKNHRYTAHFSTKQELPDAAPKPVVRDGNLITSQGAGTAIPFALALIEILFDAEISGNVADSICYSS